MTNDAAVGAVDVAAVDVDVVVVVVYGVIHAATDISTSSSIRSSH